jgi:hypothetical protein
LTIRPLNEKEHKKEELSVPAEAAVCGQWTLNCLRFSNSLDLESWPHK